MTRINLVPTKELSDQHLLAEYHELPRVIKQNIDTRDAPMKYCLGKGHMKWAKLFSASTVRRYYDLYNEMVYRGFHPNYKWQSLFDIWCNQDEFTINFYYPSKDDIDLSRNRLIEKYNLKPNYYKWTKRNKPSYYK